MRPFGNAGEHVVMEKDEQAFASDAPAGLPAPSPERDHHGPRDPGGGFSAGALRSLQAATTGADGGGEPGWRLQAQTRGHRRHGPAGRRVRRYRRFGWHYGADSRAGNDHSARHRHRKDADQRHTAKNPLQGGATRQRGRPHRPDRPAPLRGGARPGAGQSAARPGVAGGGQAGFEAL